MDLVKLEYFLAVRDHGTINSAAAHLGVAQPTISQALRSLERELGVELFHRIGRGMVSTSAGHALAGPARRLIRDIASAASSVSEHQGGLTGTVEIAASASLAMGDVVELVAEFLRRHPLADVNLRRLRSDAAGLEQLRESDVEIVLTHLPVETVTRSRPMDRPLDILELGQQEYYYAVPPFAADLVPAKGERIDLSELPEIPLVIVTGGVFVAEIATALARSGRAVAPAAILEHREARLAFVAAGVGATFLERSLVESAAARGVPCRPCEPPLRRPYGLVYQADELSPPAEAFISLAAERVASAVA